MTMKTYKKTFTAIFTATLAFSILGTIDAYAISDTGPWDKFGSNPNGQSGNAFGSADTNGNGELEVTASGFDGVANAFAFFNIDSNGDDGDDPVITTSASTIYFGGDSSYDIDITRGTFGTAEYKTGAQLHKIVNNNPVFQKTCLISTISSAGPHSANVEVYCNDTGFSGTNTFITEGIHTASATAPVFGTNSVDARGFEFTDTTELIICNTDCGN